MPVSSQPTATTPDVTPTSQPKKKPYTSPAITNYGTIAELTHGLTGPEDDAGGGSMPFKP